MNLCKKIEGKHYCIAKKCKKIDGKYYCTAEKDTLCRHWRKGFCAIGDLFEIDQKTLDEEARI